MLRRFLVIPLAALSCGLVATLTMAVPPTAPGEKANTNGEAADAARRVRVEKGLTVSLWASEPLMANPVSFCFDHKGHCFIAETTRFGNGVPDTRGYMKWLDDDIGARTVDDRLAMYKKFDYKGYTEFSDQVRQVWDSTNSGKADKSTVFSGGYNQLKDGLGAGVLARDGGVYFTCIPDLYLLKDTKGTGVADQKTSLSTGYGVRAQFLGHDLHGLRVGPDHKLYFSIGDRGFKVQTKEGKTLANPDSGAVLRCELDGANLEIVHVGLRNPQELAFDDAGNLFTWDNNSDSGDQARWVQIVEGGDSGWRCGYQYGTLMHHAGVPQGNRGPWNTEKIWHVPSETSVVPAYIVPAIKHFGNGPSGLTHFPGVGLAERYKGHFFGCDFTSTANNSVVWSWGVKPKGASFEVTDLHKFVQEMVPTDCEFGPDGAFYVLDWVGGWSPPGKGRIFKVTDAEAMKNPAVAEAQKLLAEGFQKRDVAELVKLLGHAHREVRFEAQYELGNRGAAAFNDVLAVALDSKRHAARLHAIWAIEDMARKAKGEFPAVPYDRLAADADSEIRAQVARSTRVGREVLLKLMADADLHVKALAVTSFGRNGGSPEGVPPYGPVFALLKANNDQDAYLRQAGVQALTTLTRQPADLVAALRSDTAGRDSAAVRLGVVLALRKLQARELTAFVADADPRVVVEAVRAIYDLNLTEAMPAVAALAATPALPEAVGYRAIAANYKLGTTEAAARIADVAARSGESDFLREFALKLLADWAKPARRDPVTGLTQSLPERPAAVAVEAVKARLAKLFVGSDLVRKEAAAVTAKLGIAEVGPLMRDLAADAKQPVGLRVDALYALDAVKAKELGDALQASLESPEAPIRAAARFLGAKADPKAAAESLPKLLADAKASAVEKQLALTAMATLPESAAVDQSLAALLDQAKAGQLPPELRLEVTDAAAARVKVAKLKLHAPLKEKLAAVRQAEKAASGKDSLAEYRDALAGGDALKGRDVFYNSAAVYCQRCHKVDGQGGEVGPVLNGIGSKHPRDYFLESIVYPNAKIAEGYQSVIVSTADGQSVSGVLRSKDAKAVVIVTAENKVITVAADDVEAIRPDKSAMPEELHKKITRRELRDVVEFLASLKEPAKQ